VTGLGVFPKLQTLANKIIELLIEDIAGEQ